MQAIPFLRAFAAQAIIAIRTQDEWVAKMDAIPQNQESMEWHAYKARRKYILVEDYATIPWT